MGPVINHKTRARILISSGRLNTNITIKDQTYSITTTNMIINVKIIVIPLVLLSFKCSVR